MKTENSDSVKSQFNTDYYDNKHRYMVHMAKISIATSDSNSSVAIVQL